MFYLIEQSYVGSDPDYLDSRIYRVQTVPGKSTNSGTVNDWTHCARGEYSSLEEAQAEIFRLTQDYYRECEAVPDSRETRQEVYRVRAWLKKYQSLSTDSSATAKATTDEAASSRPIMKNFFKAFWEFAKEDFRTQYMSPFQMLLTIPAFLLLILIVEFFIPLIVEFLIP